MNWRRGTYQTTYRQDLYERIARITQGYVTVAENLEEFYTLSSRADVNEPVYIIVGRYMNGFNKPVRDIMCLSIITTIVDAFQAILNAESRV